MMVRNSHLIGLSAYDRLAFLLRVGSFDQCMILDLFARSQPVSCTTRKNKCVVNIAMAEDIDTSWEQGIVKCQLH